jgi:hypothetical protein
MHLKAEKDEVEGQEDDLPVYKDEVEGQEDDLPVFILQWTRPPEGREG